MHRTRKAFTILELLMVIGIISVLIGITVSAVSGSLTRARSQKKSALCRMVEQGLATYYAQKGEWPEEPGEPKKDESTGIEKYTYDTSTANEMVRKVVRQTKEGNPMIDASGLFVARGTGINKYGTDFMTAIRGTKKTQGYKLSEMAFGYPDPNTGKFKQFTIIYYPGTDKMEVN